MEENNTVRTRWVLLARVYDIVPRDLKKERKVFALFFFNFFFGGEDRKIVIKYLGVQNL